MNALNLKLPKLSPLQHYAHGKIRGHNNFPPFNPYKLNNTQYVWECVRAGIPGDHLRHTHLLVGTN